MDSKKRPKPCTLVPMADVRSPRVLVSLMNMLIDRRGTRRRAATFSSLHRITDRRGCPSIAVVDMLVLLDGKLFFVFKVRLLRCDADMHRPHLRFTSKS